MFILPGQSYQPALPFLSEPFQKPPWIKLLQRQKQPPPKKTGHYSYDSWPWTKDNLGKISPTIHLHLRDDQNQPHPAKFPLHGLLHLTQ